MHFPVFMIKHPVVMWVLTLFCYVNSIAVYACARVRACMFLSTSTFCGREWVREAALPVNQSQKVLKLLYTLNYTLKFGPWVHVYYMFLHFKCLSRKHGMPNAKEVDQPLGSLKRDWGTYESEWDAWDDHKEKTMMYHVGQPCQVIARFKNWDKNNFMNKNESLWTRGCSQ